MEFFTTWSGGASSSRWLGLTRAPLPSPRMAARVQNGADLDDTGLQRVIDGERKATNQGTTEVAVHDSTCGRHVGQEPECAIDLRLELRPEAWALGFIPSKSLRDIREGFRPELKPIGHYRSPS